MLLIFLVNYTILRWSLVCFTTNALNLIQLTLHSLLLLNKHSLKMVFCLHLYRVSVGSLLKFFIIVIRIDLQVPNIENWIGQPSNCHWSQLVYLLNRLDNGQSLIICSKTFIVAPQIQFGVYLTGSKLGNIIFYRRILYSWLCGLYRNFNSLQAH